MNVIDALLGEHAVAKAVLDALEQDPSNESLFNVFMELLDSHAKIEEELLYNDGKAEGSLPPNVAEDMKAEHKLIKRDLEAAQEAKSLVLRRKRINELAELVRHHLHDEETRVFPKAVGIISDEKQAKLERRWAEFRKVGV